MDRRTATEEIKARWHELYPADDNGRGNGIVCPLCGSGTGPHGTGITDGQGKGKKAPRNHFLKCWNGGCIFNKGGSVIDLYMLQHKMDPETDFSRAVNELAAALNISIDPYTGSPGKRSTAAADFKAQGAEADGALEWDAIISADEPQQADSATTTPEAGTLLNGTASAQAVTDLAAEAANYAEYIKQCNERLVESKEAQAYLQQRGISIETAFNYYLGYDPAWISPTVKRNQQAKGRDWLPAPKPVIIMPSRVTHYVARDIRPDNEIPDNERRYKKMNEGTPGLFGWGFAFKKPEDGRPDPEVVFITEGAFDALSIIEAGQTAIALNSTSNADMLIEKLKERPTTATLILCLDKDEAGKATADKLKTGLQRLNISFVSADICGAYKDPNEALTADRAAFIADIKKAVASTAARPDSVTSYVETAMAAEIEQFKQAQNRMTGFANLDEKAGGLNAGLYVLAAISSLGKTTLALQMADQLAAAGHEVLFFSMEQSRLELISKSIARMTAQIDIRTAVNSLAIRRGYLPPQVLAAKQAYTDQIGERLSIIEGNFNCDIGFIADYIRRHQKRTNTPPIVFIDYLQILQPAAEGKSHGSKKEEVDMAITELKRLSRDLNTTIIVISSINRANYMTPFSFESLKESGQIEFTADVVWGLQLGCLDEDLFDKEGHVKAKRKRINEAKEEDPRKIKFVCLKNRYGISHFECDFNYYARHDLFVPTQTPDSAARTRIKKGGI